MWYDLLVIGILAFFTLRGAMRGVIWQLAGIAGIVLCFFFAQSISAMVGPRINLQPPLNHWVALFAAYLFFSFIAFGLARILNDWVEKAQLKEFNRHLGALFGLVKGGLLCLVLTFLLVTVSEGMRESLKDSRSARYAAIAMNQLRPLMPEKLHEALAQYIDRLDFLGDPGQPGASGPSGPLAGTGDPFAGSPASSGTNGSATTGSPPPVTTDLWGQLRSSLGTDVQNLVINALRTTDPSLQGRLQNQLAEVLRTTPPEQIPVLRQQLLQHGSTQIDQVLANWLAPPAAPAPATGPATGPGIVTTPTTTPPSGPATSTTPALPVGTPSRPGDPRQALIREVAGFMSSIPVVRSGIEQQLSGMLSGVPEAVAIGVLQDLLVDIRGGGQDPDPSTSARSTVEQRILRQLQIQRVPITTLSPALQDHLRQAQATSGGPL